MARVSATKTREINDLRLIQAQRFTIPLAAVGWAKMRALSTHKRVDGLRVIDASIMPAIIVGNTNAATMMIAENVADMTLGAVANLGH